MHSHSNEARRKVRFDQGGTGTSKYDQLVLGSENFSKRALHAK